MESPTAGGKCFENTLGLGVLTEASKQNSVGLSSSFRAWKRVEPGSGETVSMKGENRGGNRAAKDETPNLGKRRAPKLGAATLPVASLAGLGQPGLGEVRLGVSQEG